MMTTEAASDTCVPAFVTGWSLTNTLPAGGHQRKGGNQTLEGGTLHAWSQLQVLRKSL